MCIVLVNERFALMNQIVQRQRVNDF